MILARQDGLPYQWYQTHLWLTLVISCMFCRMNGRFHTVLHRVIVNKTNQRLSAASIFFFPSMDLMLGPLSKLTGSKQGPIYKSVSCTGYLKLEKKYAALSKNCKDSAFPNPTINLLECTSLINS